MTIYAWLEVARLVGWLVVLSLLISNKRHMCINTFWMRIIITVTMMTASINDLLSIDTIQFKSLYWFVGNLFIIVSYIYEATTRSDQSKILRT